MSELTFTVAGTEPMPFALVPTLGVRLRIAARGGQSIDSIVLRSQIRVEADQRRYDDGEQERLLEVFGQPHRWGDTVKSFVWTHVATSVGRFDGSTEVDVPVECSYDLEVAAGKYFHALRGGEIPMLLLFSGTVFTRGPRGLQAAQIPWDREARHRLPVAVWRQMMDAHFPDAGWLRLRRETIDALMAYKARHALPTWDDTVDRLMGNVELES